MACACKSGANKTDAAAFIVHLPDGRTKSYRTEIAARAELQRIPGSYLRGETQPVV